MRARGYPMPDLYAFGTLADQATFSLREFVPGEPMQLSNATVPFLVELIEMQAAVELDIDQDWSRWVHRVLMGFEENYGEALESYGETTASLWRDIARARPELSQLALPANDMVHGDFRPDNLILSGDRVAGVIDYEYAGKGSRIIDVATLIEESLVHEVSTQLEAELWKAGDLIAGETPLALAVLYVAVEMTYWFILKENDAGVRAHVSVARDMLNRL